MATVAVVVDVGYPVPLLVMSKLKIDPVVGSTTAVAAAPEPPGPLKVTAGGVKGS